MSTALLILAAITVRNPFWPIGYEGTRETITAEPVVEVKTTAATADDETATSASTAPVEEPSIATRHWADARKTLRVGGIAVVTDADGTKRQCIMINGLAYGDGDLISITHENRRFTWRVQGLTKGATVKLSRVRARLLETESDDEPKLLKEKTK